LSNEFPGSFLSRDQSFQIVDGLFIKGKSLYNFDTNKKYEIQFESALKNPVLYLVLFTTHFIPSTHTILQISLGAVFTPTAPTADMSATRNQVAQSDIVLSI
jgi:hypothetical protein